MSLGDQHMHHVEGRDAAGASQAPAIDLVDRGDETRLREGLCEGCRVLPVDRAAIPVEKTGGGQHERPARDTGKPCSAAGETSQPGKGRLVIEGRWIARRTDNEAVIVLRLADRVIGREGQAGRGLDHTPFERHMAPAVEVAAGQDIGGAEGLDRRGVGHRRKARHQEEAEPLLFACLRSSLGDTTAPFSASRDPRSSRSPVGRCREARENFGDTLRICHDRRRTL
ncbi:hypothetical protein SAMN06297251_11599 [Fulvimarina manganoxydans]|uniref:Uncharacterized protein n=1 Tax=Fulvimarina manganoxydans TaxID=937218 RepID=A0A1W2DJJ9_9HYPH|nr:hypothetical protein SAMN06297251_11599 [Fulvimarina manganoxydans]